MCQGSLRLCGGDVEGLLRYGEATRRSRPTLYGAAAIDVEDTARRRSTAVPKKPLQERTSECQKPPLREYTSRCRKLMRWRNPLWERTSRCRMVKTQAMGSLRRHNALKMRQHKKYSRSALISIEQMKKIFEVCGFRFPSKNSSEIQFMLAEQCHT